jgi:hypothetical protein
MATELRELRIRGVHPVLPSSEEFDEALEIQWGAGLEGTELERARQSVKEHFSGLFLIEIEIKPVDADFDWGEITQPIAGVDKSNWQVPFDEQPVDSVTGRWVFFLHFVDLTKPISTPLGDRLLPSPTPIPPHLASIKYEVPG